MASLTTLWFIASIFIVFTYYSIFFKTLRHMNRPPEVITEKPNPIDEEHSRILEGVLTSHLYKNSHFDELLDICPANYDQPLTLLIAVVSKASKKARRLSIRKTWGHYSLRCDVKIIFIYGNEMKETTYESEIYGDIVITSSSDHDLYSSLKTVALLEYVALNCTKVKYVLKTNDDVFINVPAVLEFIQNIPEPSRSIFGFLRSNQKTMRGQLISNSQYNRSILPDYLEDDTYLFRGSLAGELYENVLNTVYISVENVFITGIVADNLKIPRINRSEFNCDFPLNMKAMVIFSGIICVKTTMVSKQYKVWEKINMIYAENVYK